MILSNTVRMMTTLLVVVMLFGCASVQQVPSAPPRSTSEHVVDRNYEVGVPRSAYVGEPIVRVKDYWETTTETTGLAADRSASINLPPFSSVQVVQGQMVRVDGLTERDGTNYRLIRVPGAQSGLLRFLLNDDGTLEGSAINHLSQRMGFSYKSDPPGLRFIADSATATDRSRGYTNFEIIYSGSTKDEINLLYREYTPDDMARPAFSQSLTYPKDASVLRFREIVIGVQQANSEQLRYVVEAEGLPQ